MSLEQDSYRCFLQSHFTLYRKFALIFEFPLFGSEFTSFRFDVTLKKLHKLFEVHGLFADVSCRLDDYGITLSTRGTIVFMETLYNH